jgi:hypothetical protein
VSAVLYSTVQYSTVQYSPVQSSPVQSSTVQYSTVQYSTVQYSTVQDRTVQYSDEMLLIFSHSKAEGGSQIQDVLAQAPAFAVVAAVSVSVV